MRNRWFCAMTLALMPGPQPIAAEALAPAPANSARANSGFAQWEFESRKEGKRLGSLTFDFTTQDGELIVQRRERLTGRKFLVSFKLDQSTSERWRDGELRVFEGHSVAETSLGDQDKRLVVRRGDGGKLLAEHEGESTELPSGAWPATFWNVDFMDRQQLFDVGAGQLATITAQRHEQDRVEADGGALDCTRYEASLAAGQYRQAITVWYDDLGRLCGLRQDTGGEIVEYRRVRAQ